MPEPHQSNVMRQQFMRQRRAALNLPLGLERKKAPPSQSAEIIQIHQQIAQKRQRINQLVSELRQMRQQLQTTQESSRLNPNNLQRQSLLLK